MVGGAARVSVEKALQEASAALAGVKEKSKAGEEELSGIVAVFLQKNKVASKEIANMRKQGTHMAKASTKCGNDLHQMSREFWAWLSKALRSELSHTVSRVLEQAAALWGCEQASVEEFSIKDMEDVLKSSEVSRILFGMVCLLNLRRRRRSSNSLGSTTSWLSRV